MKVTYELILRKIVDSVLSKCHFQSTGGTVERCAVFAGRQVTSEARVAERVLTRQRARLTQRLEADRTLEDLTVDGIE